MIQYRYLLRASTAFRNKRSAVRKDSVKSGIVGPQDRPIYSPHHLAGGHYVYILPLSAEFNLKGIVHSEI